MRAWKLAGSLVLIALLLLTSLATAAGTPNEGINLQISPLPIELTTKPSSTLSTDLRVRNAGTEPEKLQVHILKVTEDDNGLVHLSEPTKDDEWVKWISFSKTIFDAPPGEWQTIKMTINPPKTAAFGYYFAVEYMRANPEQPQPGKAVARGAVATFILLNVDVPGAVREAQVVSFTADHKVYEFLPASFTVKVRATGNVHVAPHGNVFITKGGHQVDSLTINEAEGNILPKSSRFFQTSWNNGFPRYQPKLDPNGQPVQNKHGQTEQTLHWDFSKANLLRFGHYTANLLMVYDNGQRDVPIQASVSFWVIPWRIIGAILGLIALIAALVIYIVVLRRRLKRTGSRKVRSHTDA